MPKYDISSDGSSRLRLELTLAEATVTLTELIKRIEYYLTHEQYIGTPIQLVFNNVQPIKPKGYDLRVMSPEERATEDKVRRLAQQGYYRDEAVEVALDLKKALQTLLDYDGRQ
jgi:hypothetical protein